MLDSKQALQAVFENYPDFKYYSDYYYDSPELEVLICVEMYHFANYIWGLFMKDESLDFHKLRQLLTRLILEGNERVSGAITLCFNEALDSLDDEAGKLEYTRKWLIEMGPILYYYRPFILKGRCI